MTKETSCRKGCDTRMMIRPVSTIYANPLSSISDILWSERPRAELVMYSPASSRSRSLGGEFRWRQRSLT